METLSYENPNDYSKMFGYIKKALECMKELAVVEFKCTSINNAMQLTEKNDLWEVPLKIKEILPEYKIYMRHHHVKMDEETVCYAKI